MDRRWPHTGAVLAGGASARMGHPKEDLPFGAGATMFDAVASTLESFVGRVVVVGREFPGRQSISDLRKGAGPLGGVEALLKSGIDDEYLVCPSDIPLATPELLMLLTAPSNALATIFDVTGGGPMQSLPLRISAGAAPSITTALDEGHNAIHSFLASIDVDRIVLTPDQATGLLNINTPEDYSRLSQ